MVNSINFLIENDKNLEVVACAIEAMTNLIPHSRFIRDQFPENKNRILNALYLHCKKEDKTYLRNSLLCIIEIIRYYYDFIQENILTIKQLSEIYVRN